MPKCNVEEVVGEPPPFQRLHEVFLCQSEFAADRETESSKSEEARQVKTTIAQDARAGLVLKKLERGTQEVQTKHGLQDEKWAGKHIGEPKDQGSPAMCFVSAASHTAFACFQQSPTFLNCGAYHLPSTPVCFVFVSSGVFVRQRDVSGVIGGKNDSRV